MKQISPGKKTVLPLSPKKVYPKDQRENLLAFVAHVKATCPSTAQSAVFPLLDTIIIKEAALAKTQQQLLGNKILDSKNMKAVLEKLDHNNDLYCAHNRLVEELNQFLQKVILTVKQNA
jgi:hypothetical protein